MYFKNTKGRQKYKTTKCIFVEVIGFLLLNYIDIIIRKS